MDEQKRVTLSLNLGMPEERALYEAYRNLPRSRGQEFLRRCLMTGFLSRKRSLLGYLGQNTEPVLKTNQQDDMISRSGKVPVWRSHENIGKPSRRPFMSDDALPPSDFNGEAQAADHTRHERQPGEGVARRKIGWKRPVEARTETSPVQNASQGVETGQDDSKPAADRDQTAPEEASRLAEKLMRSVGNQAVRGVDDRARALPSFSKDEEETERSGETGSSGGNRGTESDEVRDSRGSGGTGAGKGANLLKGFFGEE